MDKRSFYFKQKVTHQELNGAFDAAEQAIWNALADLGLTGIISNAGVTQHSPTPDLTVDVSGSAVVYDPQGERIHIATNQTVNIATDFNGISTAVSGGANSKIVSVFAKYARSLSDPRVDGNSTTVYFVSSESFSFKVIQGTEALSPVAPTLQADAILLADVTLVHSQTAVHNGDISTTRRQDAIALTQTPLAVRRGKIVDAFTDLLTAFNAHVNGTSYGHTGAALAYGGGGNWADGTTNPSATVEAQLDKIITDLAGAAGTGKIGAPAAAGSHFGLSAGTLTSQLAAIQAALNGQRSVIDVQAVNLTTNVTQGTGFADYAGLSVSIPGAHVGDIVLLFASSAFSAVSGDLVQLKLQANENGGGYADVTSSEITVDLAATVTVMTSSKLCSHTVGSAGTLLIKGQGKSTAGSGGIISPTLIAILVRP